MTSILFSGCACLALYLLLAGSVSASELGTGAVLAVLAGLWTWAARRTTSGRFAFSAAHAGIWLRQIARLPGATVRTGAALLASLAGRRPASPGRSDERAFRQGPQADPAERARRATAVLAASIAPASYVVRMESETALFHGVSRKAPEADPEWLA